MAKPRLGFIGLGLMGARMVPRLLAAGYSVAAWNRSPEKAHALGLACADSPAALAAQVDILMLCVSDTAAVESVMFSAQGVAEGAHSGLTVVDFSSISPSATRDFARRLERASGAKWVDCPVSGGTGGAETGTLVMMAGGDAEHIDALRPIFAHLSQRLTRMGDVGAGQVTKVCNQLIVAANSLLIAEAVALAERNGVDASQLAPALAGGFADSKPFQILAPRMATQTYTPVQWKVATLLKDLDNALHVAAEQGFTIPMAHAAAERLRDFAQQGENAERDLSTVIESLSHAETLR